MNLELRFTLTNQDPQTVPVGDRVLIGTLLSNDVVLRAPGIEPIHAMIERNTEGEHIITDLGSDSGIYLNGKKVDVEEKVALGDVLLIGDVKMDVLALGASKQTNFNTATTLPPLAAPSENQLSGEVQDQNNFSIGDQVQAGKILSPGQNESSRDSSLGNENNPFTFSVDPDAPKIDNRTQIPLDTLYVDAGKNIKFTEKQKASDIQHEDDKYSQNEMSDIPEISRAARAEGAPSTEAPAFENVQKSEETVESADRSGKTSAIEDTEQKKSRGSKDQLFSPRKARPQGDVLEVVSYWGNTVLDVELFHPKFRGYENPSIGIPPKAHFLAGGKKNIREHVLAKVGPDSFNLRLLDDMVARIKKNGKIGEKKGPSSINLRPGDIAQIVHGPVKFFLMHVKPPPLKLPRQKSKDPFFAGLVAVAALFYLMMVPAIYFAEGNQKDELEDDIWSIVNLPEKKPEPVKEVKPPPPPKPKQQIAEVKKPAPTPKPPKPKPKPPKPVQPKEMPKTAKIVEKPKQPKPVEKPTKTLTQAKPKPKAKPNLAALSKAASTAGMVSTGVKKPDFKAPGKKTAGRVGPSGGERGGGKPRPNAGGARKGKTNADVRGVEGGAPGKASGVNLSKLGLGAGKILNKAGAGAIKTNFRSSAGGVGGGSGSASKTYGLGGPGAGRSLGVSGAGGAVNNFGGYGGSGSGQGGSGGLGGAGLGGGFGRKSGSGGRANVVVPPGDPVISGGLTQQEVAAVIRANLNQIRHCYEQLLQRSPNAAGKIKVSFQVTPRGSVGRVGIGSSSIGDAIMKGCVTGKIRRWKFPKPRGGQPVDVNYPFVFNPL